MTQHRGIGHCLLDGRQIKIMAFMEQGLDQQARDLIDATQATEPWETHVAQLLRAHCRPAHAPLPGSVLAQARHAAVVLLADPEPSTAVFQTRAGLAALELDASGRQSSALLEALADVARLDAYASREVLHHPPSS